MALPPQKFRELVFQLIYSTDFSGSVDEALVPFMMHQLSVTKKSVCEALARTELIKAKLPEIDRLITETSNAYDFNRITGTERNILRLALFELFFDSTIPSKVAISEAVRLSRKFSSPESSAFVNAILDALYKKSVLTNPEEK